MYKLNYGYNKLSMIKLCIKYNSIFTMHIINTVYNNLCLTH